MGFCKNKHDPVERLESGLGDKQAAREKLADRLSAAEVALAEKRAAAERLAIAGATNAELDRAEADMRAADDRVKTLRSALEQLEQQIAISERELADAKAQRDRDMVADELEAMGAAITQAVPRYDAAATALIEAVTKSAASVPEATAFAIQMDAVRRDVGSAATLICSELRSAATLTRSGDAKIAFNTPPEPPPPDGTEAVS